MVEEEKRMEEERKKEEEERKKEEEERKKEEEQWRMLEEVREWKREECRRIGLGHHVRETRAAPTGKAAVFPFSCYNLKCLYVNKTVTIQAYIKHLKDKHSIDVRDNYSVTIRNKYLPRI